MKKLKLFLAIIGFIMMASCSSDNGPDGNRMKVSAKGTYVAPGDRAAKGGDFPSYEVTLTSFRVNVDQVTLKYYDAIDDDDNDDGDGRNDGDEDHDYKKITVTGPWELDLLNQTTPITTITVPNGTYKKAELHLSKSLVATSPIFNKTVEIKGTVNGVPFVFWHDYDQILKLNYAHIDESAIINNNSFDLVFNFDLNKIIDMVDLSSAQDGDGDGVIEIGPNDTDGNNELAILLNQHFGGCGGIEHHHDDD